MIYNNLLEAGNYIDVGKWQVMDWYISYKKQWWRLGLWLQAQTAVCQLVT